MSLEQDIAVDESLRRDGSDYGDFGDSEEELDIINNLLIEIESQQPNSSFVVTDIEDYEAPTGLRLPKILGAEKSTRQWETQTFEDPAIHDTAEKRQPRSPPPDTKTEDSDNRSPLERFRRPPKKALSVTDLVSPAWCELQYHYTLAKHGRKRRTPAMKQGTTVHQALEDEVHTTVPVEITTKEDSWGLRIWNIIQGLRTLQDTGRTRELEVWGTVGGEIVNGVIDELSYECPDPRLEEQLNGATGAAEAAPEYQTSITDYLMTAAHKEQGQSMSDVLEAEPHQRQKQDKRIYITDVKTRASPTLPTGSSLRPTVLQLHLYHHMIENIVQGNFSLDQLAARYEIDTTLPFTDAFIAQIGNLNQDLFRDVPPCSPEFLSSQDSVDILVNHNNLSALWSFMLMQFRNVFLLPSASLNTTPTPTPQSTSELPNPATQPTRLSPILTAEYLAPTYKHTAGTRKKTIGTKSFVFNPLFLKSYLEDNLQWWRGEREARGVELVEAWKCRSCDFRNDCAWIHERDDAALRESLQRKEKRQKMREIAGVEENADTGDAGVGISKSKV